LQEVIALWHETALAGSRLGIKNRRFEGTHGPGSAADRCGQ
jgi:hypothetical protein